MTSVTTTGIPYYDSQDVPPFSLKKSTPHYIVILLILTTTYRVSKKKKKKILKRELIKKASAHKVQRPTRKETYTTPPKGLT